MPPPPPPILTPHPSGDVRAPAVYPRVSCAVEGESRTSPSGHLLPHRPAGLLVNWHEAALQLFVGAVAAGVQGVRLADQSRFQALLALSLSLVNSEVMRRVVTF